jgi:hypothetical protein
LFDCGHLLITPEARKSEVVTFSGVSCRRVIISVDSGPWTVGRVDIGIWTKGKRSYFLSFVKVWKKVKNFLSQSLVKLNKNIYINMVIYVYQKT